MKRLAPFCIAALLMGSAAFAAEPAKQATAPPASTVTATAPATAPTASVPTATAKSTAAPAAAAPAKIKTNKAITLSMFALIILATLGVVVWAAKKTQTAADYYTAGGGITGIQNGWAITGDVVSAASFLGMSGLISLYGIDGFLYSTGPILGFVTILLLMAEPLRNAGKYTMGDILCFRASPKPVRAAAAISTVAVSTFYLLAQMVGAGKLMQLLLDIPYKVSVIGVGTLLIIYVVFGGMKATTWVQIIKAALLLSAAVVLSILVAVKAGMNPLRLFADVVNSGAVQDHVRIAVLKHPLPEAGLDYGKRFLQPGLFLKNPLDQISLGLAWVLGAAGLPHIMMRFFTVPNAKEARKSIRISVFLMGAFFIMTTFLGFGAAIHITPQKVAAMDKGGNMATLMLAQYLGGGEGSIGGDMFLAFVCAVAFATILAVVSGLVLAASAAIAHDIYVNIIKNGKANQKEQVRTARLTSLVVGAAAIVMGIAAEKENIVALVALAFAVAASGNFPVIILSLFWRKFNTAGIVSGIVVGTIAAIGLVLVSPNMTYPKKIAADAKKVIDTLEKKQAAGEILAEKDLNALNKARTDYTKNKDGKSIMGLDNPLFPLKNPGIVSVPLGFLAAIIGCLAFRDRRAEEMFDEIYVRQNTGIGIAEAIEH
ncbi:solute symporter family protein [Geobacter grbiciae]|uniref:solute symporter family protein n=1 Tax=Geobacter grbiciae TaxID=155042 RepID=UPI001C021B82|nr:cation acetate symporter [Geobacter grbiciae]MBT1074189.1 cation acetate symporter [Geobacter grbiciae]